MQQIKSLGAKKAVILGGKLAVNESVEAQVKAAGLTVERISGTSRYDTSLAIGKETAKKAESKTVVLAYGEHFADALSVAGVAKTQRPFLLRSTKSEPRHDSRFEGGSGKPSSPVEPWPSAPVDAQLRRWDRCRRVVERTATKLGETGEALLIRTCHGQR